MNIQLNPPLETIDWNRVIDLFKAVGWNKRDTALIKMTFKKASYTCFVYLDDLLIGFGRTVDDGCYNAVLADVVVDPEYQRNGVGKAIVQKIRMQLKGYTFVTLHAAPGMHGFYQKLGWKKQTSSFMYPKDKQQEEEHCQ